MKHTFLTIVFAACAMLPVGAQPHDRSFQITEYGNGCIKLLEGIAKKDKYALYEAKEYFAKLNIETIDPVCKEGSRGEEPPQIVFCQEYADALIKANFLLSNLDDISIMRKGDDSDLLVFHKSVAAHGVLFYEWEGSGRCELMVVTKGGEELKVSVTDTTSGKQHIALPDKNSNISYVAWNMGDTDDTYSIRIENPTNGQVSFVVALN